MFFSWRTREVRQAAAARLRLRLRCRPRLEILEDRCVFSATANPVTAPVVPASVVALANQVTTQPALDAAGEPTGVTAELSGGATGKALNVAESTVNTVPLTSGQNLDATFLVNELVPDNALVLYGMSSSAPAIEAATDTYDFVAPTGGMTQMPASQPPLVSIGQVVFDTGTTSVQSGARQSTAPLNGLAPPPVTVSESLPSAAVKTTNPFVTPTGAAGPGTIQAPSNASHSHQFQITIPSGQALAAADGLAATPPASLTVKFVSWAGETAVAGYDIVVQAVTVFVVPSPGLIFSTTVSSTFIVPAIPSAPPGAAESTPSGNAGNIAPSAASAQLAGALGPVRLPEEPIAAPAPPELALAATLSSGGGELAALAISGLRPPPVTVTEQIPWTSLREYGGHRPSPNVLIDPLTETAPATAAGPPPFSGDESVASAEAAPVETVTTQDTETYLHPLYQVAERGDRSGVTDLSGTGLAQTAVETSMAAPPNRWTQETELRQASAPPAQPATPTRKETAGTLRRFGRTLIPIAATWAVIQAIHAGILSSPRQGRSPETRP